MYEYFLTDSFQMVKRTPHSTQELLILFELSHQRVREDKRLMCYLRETDEITLLFEVIDSEPFWFKVGEGDISAGVRQLGSSWNETRPDIVLEGTLSNIAKFFFYYYDSSFIEEGRGNKPPLRVLNHNDNSFDWEDINRVQNALYPVIESLGLRVDSWFDLLEELDAHIKFFFITQKQVVTPVERVINKTKTTEILKEKKEIAESDAVKFIRWTIRHKRTEFGLTPPKYVINIARKYGWLFNGYAYRGLRMNHWIGGLEQVKKKEKGR